MFFLVNELAEEKKENKRSEARLKRKSGDESLQSGESQVLQFGRKGQQVEEVRVDQQRVWTESFW